MLHIFTVASSCFPNCHPTGQPPVSGVANSGYAALGIAFVLLVVRALIGRKSGKSGK